MWMVFKRSMSLRIDLCVIGHAPYYKMNTLELTSCHFSNILAGNTYHWF